MPKLLLVDAHAYLHRAFHALPPLTTSKGEPVNALYGFARMLFKLLKEQRPDHVAVCFDAPGPTFRHALLAEYKATRKETDPDLRSQFPLSRELVAAMGLAGFELAGYEADDLIATIAARARLQKEETIIVSSDKDILQIVDDRTKVLNEPKQTLFDRPEVEKKWGVRPEQILDFLMLVGDSSDNVAGVAGIGEKTAAKLLQEFGSLEAMLARPEKLPGRIAEKIEAHRSRFPKSRELLALKSDVPIEFRWDDLRPCIKDRERLLELLKRLEFQNLLAQIQTSGIASAQSGGRAAAPAGRYETILSEAALGRLVKRLREADAFALDVETTGLDPRQAELVGLSFSWQAGEAAYIPVGHRTLSAASQLKKENVLRSLKEVLEEEKLRKIGHNLKFDFSLLKAQGITVKNLYFDTMLASYCLDPSRNSHRLKDLALNHFGVEMTRLEELVPEGAKKGAAKEFPMDQVEIEKAAPYACADADVTFRLWGKFAPLLKEKKAESLFTDVEMPLLKILAEMELRGIRVDRPYLETLDREFSGEIQQLLDKACRSAGQEFNLNSPKQLSFILFEKLKLPTLRKTKTGFSTAEEVLTQLAALHELPKILIEHRELAKLKSTYIDSLLALSEGREARIHTSFNQAVTATGRLSSSDPNLQNIPVRTEYGKRIRRAFLPEKGNVFLSADYSQIDLRVLAHLSGDAALTKAFQEGADIHLATAAEVFHCKPSEVGPEQRRRAKAINFGIVYGQQAYGLSQSLAIPMKEAQELIDHYFQRYPGVQSWIDRTIEEARKEGCVKTLLGRIRYIPEINSKNGAQRSFAERTAMNTPVQGTSADIIKLAMIRLAATLERKGWDKEVKMLLQVHDDLLFELPGEMLREAAPVVRKEMENAVQLSVPVTVDLKQGSNWADLEPLG